MVKIDELKSVLRQCGGVLRSGSHGQGTGAACLLEAESIRLRIDFTDDPEEVGMWDLRYLNDIDVSDEVRTECLIPVWAKYIGSATWKNRKADRVCKRLVLAIVNRLIAELPGLPEAVRDQCRSATTQDEGGRAARAAWAESAAESGAARAAWSAARSAAAARAAWSARSAAESGAARAARSAARSAAESAAAESAAREKIFRLACNIFVEAATE